MKYIKKKQSALHKSICVRPFCSHDYHQRSVTSTSIEAIIDDSTDKRDTRRHQQPRINNSRQQQYSGQISTNSTKDRAYIQGIVVVVFFRMISSWLYFFIR